MHSSLLSEIKHQRTQSEIKNKALFKHSSSSDKLLKDSVDTISVTDPYQNY
jgi:hypothetical protein